MQNSPARIVSIGECMVELARGSEGSFSLAYGGDTFNTAVYLARAGLTVSYATALGDDPYSDGIVALAQAEGISTDLIARHPGRMPGLYMIETTTTGERSFHYWRDRAPARELFDTPSPSLEKALQNATLIYLSGITLSLYAPPALDRLAACIDSARTKGTRVAMDGNYRPRGWGGDRARARAIMQRFWQRTDVALPTFDDEQALWDDADPAAAIARLHSFGIGECVIKQGPDGAIVSTASMATRVSCPAIVEPVDTTAAGDSFNAGYLARRLAGDEPQQAAAFAHSLAAIVIQHRGAVVPPAATVGLFA